MADKKISDFTSTPIPAQTDLIAGVNAAETDNIKIPVSAFATGAEGDLATTAVQVVSGTAPIVSTPSGTTRTISIPAATALVDGYMPATDFSRLADTSGINTGDNATNSTSNSYADAKVADAINNGTTTIAPSQNAVFDALALKAPLVSPSFTTPSLGDATATTINGGTISGSNTGDNAANTTANAYADSKVADAINNGTTTIAPSQNAVFDALALKEDYLDNPGTDGHVLASTTAGVRSWVAPGGTGGSAHIIADDGTPFTERATLNFIEDFDVVDNNPTTDVKLSVANKASLDAADTAVQSVNAITGTAVSLDVFDIPQAVEEVAADATPQARVQGGWVPLSSGSLPSSKWEISTGVPTAAPSNPDAFKLDQTTGIFYRWKTGSAGVAGYSFDGTTQYATMPEWTTLGDPDIYSTVTYDYTGADVGVIDPAPVSQFGRTGTGPYVYHSGNISNLSLTDASPLQGKTVYANAAAGTFTAINMTNGVVSLDFKYVTADANAAILDFSTGPVNFLYCDAGYLKINSANCVSDSLYVDGVQYAGYTGPLMVNNQHYSVSFSTISGSMNRVYSRGGMQNLVIQVTN